MFWVYILFSPTKNKYYIGYTENLNERIAKHNNKHKGFTSLANDWKLVWSKQCDDIHSAISLERFIKKQKSRKFIENLIADNHSEHPDP